MMKYILQKKEDRVYSYLLDEDGHALEIHADAPADGPKLGDIYIGLVQKVAKNINAAFVEIIPGMSGYLPFDELIEPVYTLKGPSPDIQAGDQLVVQISRDAFGDKDVSLTTKLTLKSRNLILTSGGVGLGVSRKIPEEQRQSIRDRILSSEEFARLQDRIGPCGIVVRTNAAAPRSELLRELADLEAQMTDLKFRAPYRTVFTNLKKQPPRWMSRIMQLPGGKIESVITDDMSLFRQLKQAVPDDGPMIRFYEDSQVAMEKLFSLERELGRALSRFVNLKSGAGLVIESTEALHVIDVNSGRIKDSGSKEEALLAVNLEAAREAARQIRLRNLSGIIVIDFINLKEQKNSLRILEELRRAVQADTVRTQVVDMTKLGLVELTRQKVELPLAVSIHQK